MDSEFADIETIARPQSREDSTIDFSEFNRTPAAPAQAAAPKQGELSPEEALQFQHFRETKAFDNRMTAFCQRHKIVQQLAYLKPKFGRLALRDVRKRDIVPFLMSLSKTGPRVAKYAKCVGSMIYNQAVQLEVIEANPFTGKMLPKVKRTVMHDTTLNEFAAMQTALRNELQARVCLALMFFGGLRPSEVRGLHWPDYDPKTRQLLIQHSRWGTEENDTKTDEANAMVPVNQPLFDLLSELHEHDGFPQDGYVLRGERGGSLNLANLARRVIAPTLTVVGLEWHGYYAMRRGAGTLATLVARDRGLAAKGLLRHKSLSTTTEYYIDSVPAETRQASDLVGELFHNCSKETPGISR
jgi:integrase